MSSKYNGGRHNKEYIFAVPTDYVFAEDRKKERWFFNTRLLRIVNEVAFRGHAPDWLEITPEQKAAIETAQKLYSDIIKLVVDANAQKVHK